MDDLHDHLAGGDALHHLLADGALADLCDEILDHRQRHVGLEQGDADLAHRVGDVALAQGATPLEAVEDAGQPAGQALEHQR
jgi:hypothetical protein